jgi:hypothetical protein
MNESVVEGVEEASRSVRSRVKGEEALVPGVGFLAIPLFP